MSKTIWKVLFYVIGITGVAFIIYSFIVDQVTPYLGMGCACTAIANTIGCKVNVKRYNPCRRTNNSPEEI